MIKVSDLQKVENVCLSISSKVRHPIANLKSKGLKDEMFKVELDHKINDSS